MVVKAFDMSDKYRVPAMVLADGMLGQMMEPVAFPEIKAEEIEKPWAANGHGHKREHNIINSLFLKPEVLEQSVRDKDLKKYEAIAQEISDAECYMTDDARDFINSIRSKLQG